MQNFALAPAIVVAVALAIGGVLLLLLVVIQTATTVGRCCSGGRGFNWSCIYRNGNSRSSR